MRSRPGPRGLLISACFLACVGQGGKVSLGADEMGRVGRRVARISKGALLNARVPELPADRIIDYGSFVWAELTPTDYARLQDAGVGLEEHPHAFALRLGGITFDPLDGAPNIPRGWGAEADTGGPRLRLVQFVGPSKSSWVEALASAGLEVVQYIFPHTYIVWGDAGARDAMLSHRRVRWVGDFLPAYRVLPRWRSLKGQQELDVLFYRGADVAAARRRLAALGGQQSTRRVLNATFEIARLTIDGAAVADASRIPGVYCIQPVPKNGGLRGEMSDQVNVNNVNGINQAFPGYGAWLAAVGLTGSGVVMANVDGGVADTHPDLINRMLPCDGVTCGGAATSGHGSHTAGIMAADGSSGIVDGLGFLRGLGVAPGANLVEQVYSPYYLQPNGMLLLMTDSYNNGALLSGNSWGPSATPLGYDDDTLQVDIGVRDADPNTPGNQPLTYVLSFMNGFGGTSTQGTPDEAKNVLTIGSTKMQTTSGQQILDIDDLSANSAHGPASDGRTIPHMVAPGCYVDSTGTGSGYFLECGTSMASPHVAGAVALFVEYYRSLPGSLGDPSAALTKAAFVAMARDLAGHRDADGFVLGHPFDHKQGWGRMDLEAVVDPPVSVVYFDNPTVFDNTGEEWVRGITADDPNQPVRIMLVWTDAPGHGLGGSTPAWNNDLDLVVEAGADAYTGNSFGADGWSQPGGAADGMNNTEGVFLGPVPPTNFTVRVIASDINSDGIPGEGDLTDQDFALVCYNCLEEPAFTIEVTPSSETVCAPADGVYGIDVGQVLGFTEPVTLSVVGEPVGTTVAFSTNPVAPPGTSVLTIGNTGAAAVGQYNLTVTGTAPTLTRDAPVVLGIVDTVPGAAILTAPADGTVDVPLAPTFAWAPSAQASHYTLEIATDAAFADVVHSASGLTGTAYTSAVVLERTTLYYWRVQADNACGTGGYSASFSFTTRDIPAVLLVDDDDNAPDVRSYYTDVLDSLGQAYDIWDTNNTDNEPDAATLNQYETVIWFTGTEFGGAAGPGSVAEAALADFLDNSHCLFISSQDYYFDRGLTGFMSAYLGVSAVDNDVAQFSVTGSGLVFGGMGPYALTYPFTNYSDRLVPLSEAEVAFQGDQGEAALIKDGRLYRTTFWGFPFESLPEADRPDVMETVLQWCATGVTPQPPQPPALPPDSQHHASKHRYLSIDAARNPGRDVALKVEIVSMKRCAGDPRRGCSADDDCRNLCDNDLDVTCDQNSQCPPAGVCIPSGPCIEHGDVGTSWFVQAPVQMGPLPDDWVAQVAPVEYSQVWTLNTLHIGDCEITPVATYALSACLPQGGLCGESFVVGTQKLPFNAPGAHGTYGDVAGPVDGQTLNFTSPDGFANAVDLSAYLLTKQNYGTANLPQTHPTWIDLQGNGTGNPPQYILNVSDLLQIKFGFVGVPWVNTSGNLQPGDCNP